MLAGMRLKILICSLVILALCACSGGIYVRDGVTDGDTFYLADRALVDEDPVLQSWVSYSLTKSTCQLQIGGDNPARASSFECELMARRLLLQTWSEKTAGSPAISDRYLDELASVQGAGYLGEYVAHHHRKRHWKIPPDVQMTLYRRWARVELPGHEPETRIIGSWNYARNVLPK